MRAATMLGKATTGSPSKGDPQQPSTADSKLRDTAVAGAPEASNQLEGGCSKGVTIICQQGGSGPDLDWASAAELQLDKTDTGGNDDVISLSSSVSAQYVSVTLENDGDDDEASMGSYGRKGDPVAGASMQPPAASSVPAVKAMMVSSSGDTGDIVLDLDHCEDTHVPGGQSAPNGRAMPSAQASDAAEPNNSVPKEQGSSQETPAKAPIKATAEPKADRAKPEKRKAGPAVTKGTKKAKNNPNASKEELSAFEIFANAKRDQVKEDYPGLTLGEVSRRVWEAWVERCTTDRAKSEDVFKMDKAEYFQVLLDAPGIRPTAICLIRTGDELDWLSVSQIHKILLSKSVHQSTVSGRARTGQESTGPDRTRLTNCEEMFFLAANGACATWASKSRLVTIKAACNLLQYYEVPASTITAVQKLQGAQPLTAFQVAEAIGYTGVTVSSDLQHADQASKLPTQASCSAVKQAGIPPARSAAANEVQAAPVLQQSRPKAPPCAVTQASCKAVCQPEQLVSLSATALGAVNAAPQANGGPGRLQNYRSGASTGADLGFSKAGHCERAAGSHRFSDREQKEAAAGAFQAKREVQCQPSLAGMAEPRKAGYEACNTAAAAGLPRRRSSCASPSRAHPPRRAQIAATKAISKIQQRAPKTSKLTVKAKIAARTSMLCPLPFGMSEDGVPASPLVLDDPKLVAEQENLVENIYSQRVFEEYKRRWDAVTGKPWLQGLISDYFLRNVNSSNKMRSDKAKTAVVGQVAMWLAFSPEQKRQYIEERTIAVELTDMSHPAYRRFKEVLEPWGLRRREQALHFCKSFPEWTLLGEYCGVWDTQDVSSEAGEDDALDIEDPVGLGPLLYDKVSDLGYTSKSAPAAAATAVRIQWTGALQLDPARAHNQLCLINDFRGVPGAPDLGNVAWVEMEDSRTLQPHLFIFTAVSVKAGQEVLLDYGEEYHKDMEAPLQKAALLVETQPEALAVHRALKARELEAFDKARKVQELQRALHLEGAERVRLSQEAEKECAQLTAQAEEERARAARMQQQLAQAHEGAQRLEKAAEDKHTRLDTRAEEEPARAASIQQHLVHAHEPASRLESAAEEERGTVSAQAGVVKEIERRIACLIDQRDHFQQTLAQVTLGAAARVQQLETVLQEQEAALQQARTEAQDSGKALRELRIAVQDMCERSTAEIDRLSKVGRGFELAHRAEQSQLAIVSSGWRSQIKEFATPQVDTGRSVDASET